MKITKKEFISLLSQIPSVFMGVCYSPAEPARIEAATSKINGDVPTRTVTRVASNHLEFSDKSRLYFDSYAKRSYERIGDVLEIEIAENGSDFKKYLYYFLAK